MPRTHETRYPIAEAAQRAGTTISQLNADIADGLAQASFARNGWGQPVAGSMTSAEVQRYKTEVVGARVQQAAAKLAAEESAKIEAARVHEQGLLLERLVRVGGGR